jgi:hypothetical protein
MNTNQQRRFYDQPSNVRVGPGYVREIYDEPEWTVEQRQALLKRLNRPDVFRSARGGRPSRLFLYSFALLLLAFLLFIILVFSAKAQAAPPAPLAKLQLPVQRHFNRKAFLAESVALTAMNVLDGYETVRDSHVGVWEAGFPKGSAELLGRYPGAGRYAAVMLSEQAVIEFAGWKLEHARAKPLRVSGHVLMIGATLAHSAYVVQDVQLQRETGWKK